MAEKASGQYKGRSGWSERQDGLFEKRAAVESGDLREHVCLGSGWKMQHLCKITELPETGRRVRLGWWPWTGLGGLSSSDYKHLSRRFYTLSPRTLPPRPDASLPPL